MEAVVVGVALAFTRCSTSMHRFLPSSVAVVPYIVV